MGVYNWDKMDCFLPCKLKQRRRGSKGKWVLDSVGPVPRAGWAGHPGKPYFCKSSNTF